MEKQHSTKRIIFPQMPGGQVDQKSPNWNRDGSEESFQIRKVRLGEKMNPCLKQFSETGWMPTHDAGKGRVE